MISKKIIAQNRKARHDYFIEQTYEAGIVLTGTEVKSLRQGKASIQDAHAGEHYGDIYLFNSHIQEYDNASRFNHNPTRQRKILLHKKEINKILGKIKQKGYTLVALSLYFNEKNICKLELGMAKGKKLYDKRQDIKERELDREKASTLREKF